MNKRKRLSREVALQLLYSWEMQGLLPRHALTAQDFITNINLERVLGHFLKSFYVKDKTRIDTPFIIHLMVGTLSKLDKIDHLIDNASANWKISRMDIIDRSILRLSCYELLKSKSSWQVIIYEAVETAKRYSSQQSPNFINGILDAIKSQN